MFDSRRTMGTGAASSVRIVMKQLLIGFIFMLTIFDYKNINTFLVDAWATSSSSSPSSSSSSSSGGGGGCTTSAASAHSSSASSLTTMLSSLINKAAPHSPNNIRRDNRNRNRNIRKYRTQLNSVADNNRRGGGSSGGIGVGRKGRVRKRRRGTVVSSSSRNMNRSNEYQTMNNGTAMTMMMMTPAMTASSSSSSSSSTTALSYSSSKQQPEDAAFTERTIRKKRKHKIYIVDRWNAMFGRLIEYKKEYGDTNVPKIYNDHNNKDKGAEQPNNLPHLGNWVSKQRYEYSQVYKNTDGREGQITLERIKKLESIDFVWELGRNEEWETIWNTNFQELKSFQLKYNSTKVPILDIDKSRTSGSSTFSSSPSDQNKNMDYEHGYHPMSTLGRWVKTQRRQRNEYLRNEYVDDISFTDKIKDRISLLNSINFEWLGKNNNDYDKWLGMYFKVLFCHTQAPSHASSSDITSSTVYSTRLMKWSEQQRQSGKFLTQHQISLLNEIPNFDLVGSNNEIIKTWNDNYNELVEYHTTYNSSLISTTVNENLGMWTQKQRIDFKANILSKTKITKLNLLSFDFEPNEYDIDTINNQHDICWSSMYERLLSYKSKYNTTIVPNHDGYDRPLANWVGNQRVKLGKYVTIDNVDADVDDYVLLVQRIANDIGCNPTDEFPPKGFIQKLSPYKIAKRIVSLNKINFVWDVPDAQWYDMYQRYVNDNNNDDVVDSSISSSSSNNNDNNNNELNLWIRVQRKQYQNDELSLKRMELLNKINFVWDPQSQHWLDMYDRLLDYKEQNNNSTLVSRSYAKDPELGLWLHSQRRAYKRKTLSEERIQYLNSIQFIWEV